MFSNLRSGIKNSSAYRVINSEGRNSTIDVFRGIAIILVVLYHFDGFLPYGYIGVDLFFVISGLLVGGYFVKRIGTNEEIKFFKFIIQRGFKIWPSYYIFLLLGIPISFFLYKNTHPSELIKVNEYAKYIFFYKNYDLYPNHNSFDQIWSLCVEEHFYIILPLSFILLQNLKTEAYYYSILAFFFILLGIVFKYFGHHATSFGTHARLDSFGWGIFLSIIFNNSRYTFGRNYIISFSGFILLVLLIYFNSYYNNFFYERVIYHSGLPISFFLMILGIYRYNFRYLKIFRLIGYYSYNWYLWHPLFLLFILDNFGNGYIQLILYLIITFSFAIIFTVLIEERFLSYREKVITKFFG